MTKVYLTLHHTRGVSANDLYEWRAHETLGHARGSATQSLNRYGNSLGVRVYEVDMEALTLVEERGTMGTHVEGQQPLF